MENDFEAKAKAIGLKEELGPYATRFAEHAMENYGWSEGRVMEVLTQEWSGAVPPSFAGGEEVSQSVVDILFSFLDFAINEAVREKDYDQAEGGWLSCHVEPSYDGPSTMLVAHMRTNTALLHLQRKTYYYDPKTVESDLEKMVENISRGIDLVRRRLSEREPSSDEAIRAEM